MKSNLLNNIKIASPCSADWDEMLGNNCKRFCSHCKLNVYNLSEMTQYEAENFLFEAEGQVCVRLYRRTDGTVITQDCPVGWQAIKQRVSRVASATFGLVYGIFGGLYGNSLWQFDNSKLLEEVTVEKEELIEIVVGGMGNLDEVSEVQTKNSNSNAIDFTVYGSVSNMNELMWIFREQYPKK